MTKITTTPIFSYNNEPLMVLKRYKISTASLPLVAARAELEEKIRKSGDASATWGYFPEIKDNFPYQASKRLAKHMQSVLQHDIQIANYPVDLAFVRLAVSEPQSSFGGFHVDVSPGIAHTWTEGVEPTANILRILFNVYDKPRRLDFYPYTAFELREKGYDIPSNTYKILNFPGALKVESILIPPLESGALYAVQFLSNYIPHAGRTNAEGHFLVSFGGYITPEENPFS